jgi:hypothetical protein
MSLPFAILLLAASTQSPALPPLPPPPIDIGWGMPLVERILRTLSEPNLTVMKPSERVVRFVMVPVFPGQRVVVSRFTVRAEFVEVTTKTLVDWAPGQGKPAVLPTTRVHLSRWSEIEEALLPGLWNYRPQPFPDPNITDGDLWYVEARGPRGHIGLLQHAPRGNPFRDLCRKLMWKSGIDFSYEEFVSWFPVR